MSGKHKAKYKKLDIGLHKRTLTLYTGQKVHDAISELTRDMNLYNGVRLVQGMEAFYEQGMKDGRKEIIDQFDGKIRDKSNYLPPGRPKKK